MENKQFSTTFYFAFVNASNTASSGTHGRRLTDWVPLGCVLKAGLAANSAPFRPHWLLTRQSRSQHKMATALRSAMRATPLRQVQSELPIPTRSMYRSMNAHTCCNCRCAVLPAPLVALCACSRCARLQPRPQRSAPTPSRRRRVPCIDCTPASASSMRRCSMVVCPAGPQGEPGVPHPVQAGR